MTNRVELNEMELDQVVGGAFHYNEDDNGGYTCRVDGKKTYHCTSNAKNKISAFIVTHHGCTLDDVINYAKQNGYFWD